MPITAEEQEVRLQTMRIGAFSGGMNTSAPINEIEDNEAVLIRNKEFDDADNLVTRNGIIGGGGTLGVWDQTNWDQCLWDTPLGVVYPSRIMNILDFEGASSFIGILYNTGNQLFSRTLSGNVTNLTGSLNLPDGVRWYWKIFNGVAIGVNGLTSGDNPIKVVSPAPGTASKLTTAPPGKLIEVWRNRVWIARSDQPNQIQASDIGTHDSWNTDAGANPAHGAQWDLDVNDGDKITGLYATKERLFVFKKKSIYVGEGRDLSKPLTDLRNIAFRKYASNIGCIAGTTICPVLDDVLFLAQGGVASLSAAQVVADFESALVSLKIADIQKIKQSLTHEDVFAFVLPDRNQYWLCVGENASAISSDITYVFDYRQIKKGITRWFVFDGAAFGTAIEVYDHDVQNLVYLLGCHDNINDVYFIGQYSPKSDNKSFVDGTFPILKEVKTKAYDFNLINIRKFLSEWFLKIFSLTDNLSLSTSYFLDEDDDSEGGYTFNIPVSLGGAFFDNPTSQFDVTLFDQKSKVVSHLIRRGFLYDKQRKARTVQFNFLNSQVNQGFGITSFGIKYQALSENKVNTV